MSNDKSPFGEEYVKDNQTVSKTPDSKSIDQKTEVFTDITKNRYGVGKPKREIIKARITE